MTTAKIAVTIDQELLTRLDRLVKDEKFPNRSRAVQEALTNWNEWSAIVWLVSAKLDPAYEQALAEEGLAEDGKLWPEY